MKKCSKKKIVKERPSKLEKGNSKDLVKQIIVTGAYTVALNLQRTDLRGAQVFMI